MAALEIEVLFPCHRYNVERCPVSLVLPCSVPGVWTSEENHPWADGES